MSKDCSVSLLDGSSGSSSSDELEDGEAEDETDSEVEISVVDTMDQTLSKKNNNDATSSNNRVIDIEVANESDSDEDTYDAGQPQMFLKKKLIISSGGKIEQVPSDLSFLVKLDWLLFNTACCSVIFVSVSYWSFICWHMVEKNIFASGYSHTCHQRFGGHFRNCSDCNAHQASACCLSRPLWTVLHNLHHCVLVG